MITDTWKDEECLCASEFTYKDNFESGKLTAVTVEYIENHETLLNSHIIGSKENIFETKWLIYNHFQYRKGLLILHGNFLYEIFDILCLNTRNFFMAKQWNFVEFNEFLNSFQIKENDFANFELIDFDVLINKRSFQIKVIGCNKYVVAETLDLRKILIKNEFI